MPPAPYRSPEGRHRHRCEHCFAIWEHDDSARGNGAAHSCPLCKREEYGWYEGVAGPEFRDHHHNQPSPGDWPPVDRDEDDDDNTADPACIPF